MAIPVKRASEDEPERSPKRIASGNGNSAPAPGPEAAIKLPYQADPIARSLLRMITFEDLRELNGSLLEHPDAGPIFAQALKAEAEKVARTSYKNLVSHASRDAEELENESYERGTNIELEDWANAMESHLPAVKLLRRLGPAANGPQLAWKALIHLAETAVYCHEGTGSRVCGFEKENDEFHETSDELLLKIAKELKEVDPASFEKEQMEKDLLYARDKPAASLESEWERAKEVGRALNGKWGYRYQKTLAFLGGCNSESNEDKSNDTPRNIIVLTDESG